jgi:hypothetical protein
MPSYIPKLITLEKSGGLFRQSEHISAYSDEKGVAQVTHEGPEYFFILDQQAAQNGAVANVSVGWLQKGQSEGKS